MQRKMGALFNVEREEFLLTATAFLFMILLCINPSTDGDPERFTLYFVYNSLGFP